MFPIRDTKTSAKTPLVTSALIITNIWVFLNELFAPDINLFIQKYALIPQTINFQSLENLTPFVTFQFLHAGFIHLASNMWFLWVFGRNLEAALGKIKFLVFYLLCGIAAGFIQYLFLVGTAIPMLGASGSIAGILGAYIKIFPKHRIETVVPVFYLPLILPLPVTFMLLYWFFTQLFNGVAALQIQTAATQGVAWWAHVGGFIAGWVLIKYFRPKAKAYFAR